MKKAIFFLLLFAIPFIGFGQKYNDLIIGPDSKLADVRSEDNRDIIDGNCSYLSAETAWNPDLSKFNNDECTLYNDYMKFSDEHLDWIDEVKIESKFDDAVGMEVEVVTFYNNGEEVPPEGFLESQIDQCQGGSKSESVKGCALYFAELAAHSLRVSNRLQALAESSETVVTNVRETTQNEIDDLKGSRKLSDVKKVKQLKNKMKSVDKTQEQTSVLVPSLSTTIASDYAKIHGISKTLKKMEEGL